jgi:RNA polymerase sigma-70 factor (ECF subfamily)
VLVRPPEERLEQPRAFLTRIATRLLIDDSRRARLERAWLEAQAALAQEHQQAPSAEAINEWLDTLEWVARLVEDLPDKPRRAFLMSRLDDMTQAEISKELGVSVSMVKKYMA